MQSNVHSADLGPIITERSSVEANTTNSPDPTKDSFIRASRFKSESILSTLRCDKEGSVLAEREMNKSHEKFKFKKTNEVLLSREQNHLDRALRNSIAQQSNDSSTPNDIIMKGISMQNSPIYKE